MHKFYCRSLALILGTSAIFLAPAELAAADPVGGLTCDTGDVSLLAIETTDSYVLVCRNGANEKYYLGRGKSTASNVRISGVTGTADTTLYAINNGVTYQINRSGMTVINTAGQVLSKSPTLFNTDH